MMKIGVTGATGFIGGHFMALAREAGHEIVAFSRHPETAEVAGASELRRFALDGDGPDVGGLDALVHLAGESVLGRWTEAKRRRIFESRVTGTRALVRAMANVPEGNRPRIFVSASATGFYGSRGDEILTEQSKGGAGFLAEVVGAWETSVFEARSTTGNVRVAALRIGLVLGRDGAAGRMMRFAFKSGFGGRFGSGKQWMPWIHVDDVARLFLFAVENEAVEGVLNATAPHPVRNAEFTLAAGATVNRPTILGVPGFALKAALGEASTLLLNSARVVPERAAELGFPFRYSAVEDALRDAIGSQSANAAV